MCNLIATQAGGGDESMLTDNAAAYAAHAIRPRVLRDVTTGM
jgi:hypothetical protein